MTNKVMGGCQLPPLVYFIWVYPKKCCYNCIYSQPRDNRYFSICI